MTMPMRGRAHVIPRGERVRNMMSIAKEIIGIALLEGNCTVDVELFESRDRLIKAAERLLELARLTEPLGPIVAIDAFDKFVVAEKQERTA